MELRVQCAMLLLWEYSTQKYHKYKSIVLSASQLSKVDNDQKLITMWLHGRPLSTQTEYRRDVERFQDFCGGRSLRELKLEDLQSFQDSLSELKQSTRRRKLNTIKSLFSFAAKLNYVPFNVAAALRLPKAPHTLAGRILTQRETLKILDAAEGDRNKALLELLYATGARVSEVCKLSWADLREREDGAIQATIFGKGGKDRVVLVPRSVWERLQRLRGDRPLSAPVFVGEKGNQLHRSVAHQVIKEAIARAGIEQQVSCHWLRHAHAQHALSKGAPLQLVRDSLGHANIATTNVYLESNPSDSSSNYLDL
jgi:integrase/recombinase XerD